MAVLSSQCSSSSQLLKHKRLTSDTPSSPANTHKKRRKKTMSLIDDNLDSENGISSVLGSLDRYRLADYLTQRTKKFSENLSLAQVEEKRVPETASWQRPRILDNLPEFIKEFSSCIGESTKLPLSLKDTGSPHTVVVTAAGLRAADITRSLRIFQTKDAIVAKLFAKHKKLIKAAEIGIGIGTPARLLALLDSGSLSMEKLERIVVDMSYIDQKKRGILDMKETFEPLVQLLTRTDLKNLYNKKDGGVDLLFF
ncbi:hypothetical protein MMC34_007934 [Xylographa carneopallida]|nr:hypothetical protein [Xylographa carneopallida]